MQPPPAIISHQNVPEEKDIKTSLENQRQANKQKFEEPYFLQIGGNDSGTKDQEGVKIVKGGENVGEEKKQEVAKNPMQKGRPSTRNVVFEAREEEEQSPDITNKQMGRRPTLGAGGKSPARSSTMKKSPDVFARRQQTQDQITEELGSS